MSQLEVDKVIPQSGTTLTLGESGDTITIASGATFTPTLIAPIIDEINDNNGNEEIIFTTTASAVNELTIANAATGNAPEIAATGDDTDIDLKLTPKGAGNLVLDGIEFPNADGSAGQALITDGSGVLSFSAVGAAAGQVIQVVSTTKTDIFTRAANVNFVDVTGVNVTITPSSASNKIHLSFYTNTGSDNTGGPTFIYYKLQRKIGAGSFADLTGATGDSRGSSIRAWTNAGSRLGTSATITADATSAFYLDSPNTTSAVVYQVQVRSTDGTATVGGTDSTADANRVSTPTIITAMEIAG
jgi:hypothetical protein